MGRAIAILPRYNLRRGPRRTSVAVDPISPTSPLRYAASLRGVTWGNTVRLLSGGAEAFPAMLEAIEAAEREVLCESYIFADDDTGRRFLEALSRAAARGVMVRLLVDGVGSLGRLPSARLDELTRAGARCLVYRPVAPWRRRSGLWRRDHRKILVVDGKVAFLGGLNIADEYDDGRAGARPWRDLHLRLEGPAARELVLLFTGTWNAETDPAERTVPPSLYSPVPRGQPEQGGVPVQIVGTRFWRRGGLIRRSFLHAVRTSTRSVVLANAYFIPDRSLSRALRQAARRGVEVRIVIPARSDVRLVDLAARAALPPLLRAGVKVAEWERGMLHAKAASVDGTWATVGSYNLDHRSLRYNLEVTANLLDPAAAAPVESSILADFNASSAVDLASLARRSWWERLLCWLAYRLRFWL